jgi:hypothetical protein
MFSSSWSGHFVVRFTTALALVHSALARPQEFTGTILNSLQTVLPKARPF